MSNNSAIQWTDATWNAITGCAQVSPGCAHCYAKVEHDRRHKAHLAGKRVAPQYAETFEVVQLHPDRLDAPLRRRRPTKYFVTSGADPFHDDVPVEYLARLFAVMALAERHTFQLLTKRPTRMRDVLSNEGFLDAVLGAAEEFWPLAHADADDRIEPWFPWVIEENWPLRNVWLGVSVENQRWANERIPLLLQTPAAVRFLSCEPLLGPVDLASIAEKHAHGAVVTYSALDQHGRHQHTSAGIDWVIVGGESGTGARPFDLQWARDIVEQCRAAGVAPFVKQLGAAPYDSAFAYRAVDYAFTPDQTHAIALSGMSLKDRHGGDMAEWPAELRVREFPATGAVVP